MRTRPSLSAMVASAAVLLAGSACDNEPNFEDLLKDCSYNSKGEPATGDMEFTDEDGNRVRHQCFDKNGDGKVDAVCRTVSDEVQEKSVLCLSPKED